MATPEVKFTAQELLEKAGQIKTQQGNFEQAVTSIAKIVNSLEGRWTGSAQTAFSQKMKEVDKILMDFSKALETYGAGMDSYARDMSDIDQKYANKFN